VIPDMKNTLPVISGVPSDKVTLPETLKSRGPQPTATIITAAKNKKNRMKCIGTINKKRLKFQLSCQ
jgi:hypothetical protein